MAEVERAKTVTPNYLAFYWNGIGFVRGEQSKGEYAHAAALLATFIAYLPPDVKNIYRPAADLVLRILGEIHAGTIFGQAPDLYLSQQHKHRILETFGNQALSFLVDAITTTMYDKGYMERLDETSEGFGSTSRFTRERG